MQLAAKRVEALLQFICIEAKRALEAEELIVIGRERRQPFGSNGHGGSQLRGERSSATAALLGVRIIELEPGEHERLFIVESHAVEKHVALRVDEDFDVFELEY